MASITIRDLDDRWSLNFASGRPGMVGQCMRKRTRFCV